MRGKRRGQDRLTPVPQVKAFVDQMTGRSKVKAKPELKLIVVKSGDVA